MMAAKSLDDFLRGFLRTLFGLSLGTALAVEDLTVDAGQSLEVSSDSDYGVVVVNGALTVKAGVTLNATDFFIGRAAEGEASAGVPATVLVEEGATVAVASWDDGAETNRFVIGDGGPATFILSQGARLTSSELRLGREDMTVAAGSGASIRLVLNGATARIARSVRTSSRSTDAANEVIRIELNGPDALLDCRSFFAWGKRSQACLAFGGGLMKFDMWYNYGQSGSIQLPYADSAWNPQSLALESVDAHPIRLWFGDNKTGNAIFHLKTSASSWIVLRGKGPLLLEGASLDRPLLKPDSQGRLRFENDGGIFVAAGVTLPFNDFSAGQLSSATGVKVRVAHGGAIDLGGYDLALDGLEAVGIVTNSSGTAATLTVGKDGGDVLFAAPPTADLPVVKAGAGALRIPDGTLANLSVESGSVEFLNRRDVGFPCYRLYVDGRSGTFRLNEVALLDGETDVTAEWTAISRIRNGGYYYGAPTGAVDRVDSTTWGDYSRDGWWGPCDYRTNRTFFVAHFGGVPSFDFGWFGATPGDKVAEVWQNAAAPRIPASFCRKVTAYRLKTDEATPLPIDWRVSGGFADGITDNVWRDLDVVRDAAHPGALSWTGTHTLSYTNASVRVGSLSLADGATWVLDVRQGRIALDSLELQGGGTLVLRNFARLADLRELPVEVVSCETAANLDRWQVVCEGKPDRRRALVFANGRLGTVSLSGMQIIVR